MRIRSLEIAFVNTSERNLPEKIFDSAPYFIIDLLLVLAVT